MLFLLGLARLMRQYIYNSIVKTATIPNKKGLPPFYLDSRMRARIFNFFFEIIY